MKRQICLLVLVLCAPSVMHAQDFVPPAQNAAESEMLAAIRDSTAAFDLVDAVLIADGVVDSEPRARLRTRLESVLQSSDDEINERWKPDKKGKKLFAYLHKGALRRYESNTTLAATLTDGTFNCVSATLLYHELASRHGLAPEVVLAPTHTYVRLRNPDVVVETTDPKHGYDFDMGEEEIIEYLLEYKLIAEEQLIADGPEEVYRSYIEESRIVDPRLLVAAAYFNRGLRAMVEEDYAEATRNIEKAVYIDPSDEGAVAILKITVALDANESHDGSAALRVMKLLPEEDWPREIARALFEMKVVGSGEKGRFDEAIATIDEAEEALGPDSTMASLRTNILVDKAWSAQRRGTYAEAHEIAGSAFERDPDSPHVREVYIVSRLADQYYRSQRGEACSVLNETRDDVGRFPDFPRQRETFIGVLLTCIRQSGIYTSDPDSTRSLLMEGFAIDSTHHQIREAIAQTWHQNAMASVRARRNRTARKQIMEALKFVPGDPRYLSTLAEINELISYE